MWGCGLDQAGTGRGQVAGTCECGNGPSGSIKCGEFMSHTHSDTNCSEHSLVSRVPKSLPSPARHCSSSHYIHFYILKYQSSGI